MIFIIFNMYSLLLNTPYYYNPTIHNFGNVGIGGKIHAELAPFATKLIDILRYDSINIRKEIVNQNNDNQDKKFLDFCCGIGESTAENSIGIDTSNEMLNVAKKHNKNSQFYNGNAENFKPGEEIDIVTCMFAMHEIPYFAQEKIIDNAVSIAKEKVIFVDISSDYTPSDIMLSGEPYLKEYIKNIEKLLENFEKKEIVENHVTLWEYTK